MATTATGRAQESAGKHIFANDTITYDADIACASIISFYNARFPLAFAAYITFRSRGRTLSFVGASESCAWTIPTISASAWRGPEQITSRVNTIRASRVHVPNT